MLISPSNAFSVLLEPEIGSFLWTSGEKKKKNQAVLIFPVYFMKAVTGSFEGLTDRSFNAATRVGSSQAAPSRAWTAAALTAPSRAASFGPRWKALGIRRSWTLTLALAALIISKGSLLGVIVCAGPRQLGSQEFLKQTARSYKRATSTKGFHL